MMNILHSADDFYRRRLEFLM